VAGALLVPLLLVATSFTHDLMRCRLTGAVIPDGACPDTATVEISHARLDAPGCCERRAAQISVVTAGPDTRNLEVLEAPRLLVLDFPAPIYRPPYRFLARAPVANAGLHAGGATLVVLKRSFLI
jgi:hypothetical protein